MPLYKVLLYGQNFWMEIDGARTRMGFYTNRFVDAASPEDAEIKAVSLLRSENRLPRILNDTDDPPMVFADEISEIAEFPPADEPGTGISHFPEPLDG